MLCDEYLSFRLEQVAASPLLTFPSRWNATAPHTPDGCTCFDHTNAPSTSAGPTALSTSTVAASEEDDAAATLLTTFNSREEDRGLMVDIMSTNGGRDIDTSSPWEQPVRRRKKEKLLRTTELTGTL